jgi:hypothetical protein
MRQTMWLSLGQSGYRTSSYRYELYNQLREFEVEVVSTASAAERSIACDVLPQMI